MLNQLKNYAVVCLNQGVFGWESLKVCDLGAFGVVGADWCLGWEESRVCNMGFWCGWGGEGKIESWGLFLLVGF